MQRPRGREKLPVSALKKLQMSFLLLLGTFSLQKPSPLLMMAIRSISCPYAHPISLELGLPDGVTAPDEASQFASVSLTDRTGHLTQDVVLVITGAGLDGPRCFVEPHPSPNQETTVLALTFCPLIQPS
ncbi:hypothetical protein D9757_003901 [Collybiopsis confluens]|uniref:Uncharacterized protein n=1 Tax=Collybiopsis confluens TaxID=2823264 RepID=A0A8H5HVL6_9AGAR|nr:hypothetical protein D9757_003901 [Collybiopsis confluens]